MIRAMEERADLTYRLSTRPLRALNDALVPSTLLNRYGGCVVCDGFPGTEWFDALKAEAWSMMNIAELQDCPHDDAEDIRGGVPSRRLLTAGGGPAQDALYADPQLRGTLSQLCGTPVVPSGTRGSYNYYSRPGDFLGLHRDIEECDVALITVLHDTAESDVGGGLVAYPDRRMEPLSAIRENPHVGAHPVPARAGQSIVIVGGLIPHCVLSSGSSQCRTISALCFQLVGTR